MTYVLDDRPHDGNSIIDMKQLDYLYLSVQVKISDNDIFMAKQIDKKTSFVTLTFLLVRSFLVSMNVLFYKEMYQVTYWN